MARRIAKAALLVLLVLLPTLAPAGFAGALQTTYSTRTVGSDRYATSALAALVADPASASGKFEPDARKTILPPSKLP